MSKLVALESIESGMILDKPLINNFGQVLLGAGTEIGEKHIRLLKTWNIAFIEIEEQTDGEENTISDEFITQAMEDIKLRMNWEPSNDFESDLFSMAVLTLAEKKMKSSK